MTILLLWINYSLMSHVNEQNLRTNLEILKQTSMPISNLLQDSTYVSLQIIGDDAVQDYFQKQEALPSEQNLKLRDSISYQLSQLLESRKYITRLVLERPKGGVYLQFGAYLPQEDVENGKLLAEAAALKGRPYWLPAQKETHYISVWDRNYEVSMLRAINSTRTLNQVIGYLRINLSEQYLTSLYSGIAKKGTQNIMIVNDQGHVVSSIDKSMLGKTVAGSEWFSRMTQLTEGYLHDGKSTVVSFYRIEDTGWYVVKLDDTMAVIQGTWMSSVIILCMLFVALFGIIFYSIQKNQIIAPVISLAKDVSNVHEDSFEIGQYATAQDEIGTLNQAFVEMSKRIEELIERVYKSQLREKEAQLSYLQSQINPHFLYNTLDSIRWMAIKEKQYEMADQIEALANLFKHALNQGKEMTTIGEEVAHLQDYLLIQKNKFGDRLTVQMDVEERLKTYPVLNLILQPIVENAITHGFQDKIGQEIIQVTIREQDHVIRFTITDNGLGTDEKVVIAALDAEQASGNALALSNINKRLKYKYGEDYGILFSSEIGTGTTVVVRIPYEDPIK